MLKSESLPQKNQDIEKNQGKVNVRWTGAAGIEFTYNGRTILIDPYLSRIGKFELFFKRPLPKKDKIEQYVKGLPGKLSGIVVGHTHFDHVLDVLEISENFTGPIVGSQSLDALLSMHDIHIDIKVCEGGERIELFDDAAVTMIPSIHGRVIFGRVPYPGEVVLGKRLPLKTKEYCHGTVFTPILELGGITFLHLGSANFIASELDGHECDVLFMCLPGWKKVQGYTSRLLEIVKPKVIIPFHYDNFTVPLSSDMKVPNLPFQDISGFTDQLSRWANGAEIRMLKLFESVTF